MLSWSHFLLFPLPSFLSPHLPSPGLRGAIPYALSLHLGLEPMEKRQLIGTTTIVIVLFTILLLGGSTMPLIRLVDIEDARARRRSKKDVNLSKTEKMGNAIESEHLSELTEEEYEAHYIRQQDLKGFMWLDAKYLNPFFTRRLTQEVGTSEIPCPLSALQWSGVGKGSSCWRPGSSPPQPSPAQPCPVVFPSLHTLEDGWASDAESSFCLGWVGLLAALPLFLTYV